MKDIIKVIITLARIYRAQLSLPNTALSALGAFTHLISTWKITDIFWNSDPEINI